MKSDRSLIKAYRSLAVIILVSVFAAAPVPAAAAEGEPTLSWNGGSNKVGAVDLASARHSEIINELNKLIAQAEALRTGNAEFRLQISRARDGSDVNKAFPWVYAHETKGLDLALWFARRAPVSRADEATARLESEMENFAGKIKADGSNPYFRLDPGPGRLAITISAPTNAWTARAPLDSRIPADFAGGTFETVPYPFADSEGKADLLKLNYSHNGTSTFGGLTVQSPLSPAVDVPAGSTIEFDVYYPKSAQGKFMRWRIRNIDSNLDSYLRGYEYNNLNPDWVGSYNGETWLRAHHSVTASVGVSSNFLLELHGETSRPAETGTLLVADIKITAPDPNGVALPDVVNTENQSVVAPLKSVYNSKNKRYMVGAIGTGPVTGTRARHYQIFVDGNNLKAESTHPLGPNWLKSVTGEALSGADTTPGLGEYTFPTDAYQAIRDSGGPGEYKSHAHVLAWYNQAPAWMRQITPANLPLGYNGTTNFYGLGNGVTTKVPVGKEAARRVQFDHTMYVMRHFLTTDAKYGSSVSRGVIPFNSWDVLNEEVHESRHSELIPQDPNNWRTSLKHTNWLAAMSDDAIGGDLKQHYIYLLFKYAHIAAPNAKMARAYKANHANLPEYMTLDGNDTRGSIDAYVVKNPPKLTYNDYGLASRSKARTVYNMVLALNTAWRSDPLYDGRPLIEDIGIQGHDSVGKTLASDNQYAMALYASLVDRCLLSGISYSEFDLKLPTSAPGGGANAPAVLNVRQSDALGYEYALMYKLFTKFAPYIDHIISWGVSGSGWQGSYVLFDGENNANAGYYGAVNPDRFILGHSYQDDFFEGEYKKLQRGYKIDLGDLGTYKR
jgi:GH35 family endo-1,4-beta-xylanase